MSFQINIKRTLKKSSNIMNEINSTSTIKKKKKKLDGRDLTTTNFPNRNLKEKVAPKY
jgi:hypothetical protein